MIKNSTVMSISTLDLQGFIVGRNFIVKEFAALREEFVFSYYIFGSHNGDFSLKRKNKAFWLKMNHHGLQWEDDDFI